MERTIHDSPFVKAIQEDERESAARNKAAERILAKRGNKHTSGPLTTRADGPTDGYHVMAGTETIATCHDLGRGREDSARANARLFSNAEALLDALELSTATLENVLLHQGKHMTAADVAGRTRTASEAQALIAKARGA